MGLGLIFFVAACDQLPTPSPIPVPNEDLAVAAENADRGLLPVAQAVAVAMEQQDVRLAVRDAMRDSPWDVHQVSFQELLGSPQGAALLRAAAAAAGESTDAFISRVRNLPDLDFYMPKREQRRSWRGEPGVVIAAAINAERGAIAGFDGAGRPVNVLAGGAAHRPVMLLTAAEPRGRRQMPQATGVGDVIQSASDGEAAVRYSWTDAAGRTTFIDPAAVEAGSKRSISMSTSSFGDSTYLDYVYFNAADSGDDMEVTFYAKFYRPDGSYLGEWTYVNYSFPYQSHWYGHQPLLLPVLPDSSTAYIVLRVREEDGVFNPDEWYGPHTFTWVDRGQIRRVNEESTSAVYVNIELDWIQRAPSRVTSVSVAPTAVYAGSTGSTSATAYDQYGWRMLSQTVSAWWTDHSYIATATGSGAGTASIAGVSPGNTSARATIAGVTGAGAVAVEETSTSCDPNLDPMCPQ